MGVLAALLQNWYWAAIGTLCAVALHLHSQTLHLRLDIAEQARTVAASESVREAVARDHEAKLAKREHQHAVEQQLKEDEYEKAKSVLENRVSIERSRAAGVRSQLAAATARSGSGSETDPVDCGRSFNRLEALGQLAGEGVELLGEGRGLLEQCRLDVQRLWDQIEVDRAASSQMP